MKLDKIIINSKCFWSRPVRIYAFSVARIRKFIEFREQITDEHHLKSLNDKQSHVRCSEVTNIKQLLRFLDMKHDSTPEQRHQNTFWAACPSDEGKNELQKLITVIVPHRIHWFYFSFILINLEVYERLLH